MVIFKALGVLFVSIPLLCWALMARKTVTGAVVGVLLLAYAWLVVAADAGWIATRAEAELDLGYAPAAAVLIAAGAALDSKQGAGRVRGRAAIGGVALGVYTALVLAFFTPFYKVSVLDDTLLPPRTEVLPLPDGLTVQADTGDIEECSHICDRTMRIGTDSGLTPDEVDRRLRAALRSHHDWRLDADGTACRPNGRLIDRRYVCIAVTRTGDGAQVYLQGYEPGLRPSQGH